MRSDYSPDVHCVKGTYRELGNLTGARVYGVSVWDLDGAPANQDNLVITPSGEAEVTVDNLKIAQFI